MATLNLVCPICGGKETDKQKVCKHCLGTGELRRWCVHCRQLMSWETFYAYCITGGCPRFGLLSVLNSTEPPNEPVG